MRNGRFPRHVYGDGVEPDPRFSLANERTFLAWIRTSLALVAAGVALDVITSALDLSTRRPSSIGLLVLGATCAMVGWFRWAGVERALRRDLPLPAPTLTLALSLAVVLVACVLAVGMVAL